MTRRMLTFADRTDIAVGIASGLSDSEIADKIGCDRAVVWREPRRNRAKLTPIPFWPLECGRTCNVHVRLARSLVACVWKPATPRWMSWSIPRRPTGRTVSHEAIYRWIYALPKRELSKSGILLRSKQIQHKRRKPLGERTGGRSIGMVSIDDRPDSVNDRRVPGAWEGDLIVGRGGKTAAATLVERVSRFTIILGLPDAMKASGLADVLIAPEQS